MLDGELEFRTYEILLTGSYAWVIGTRSYMGLSLTTFWIVPARPFSVFVKCIEDLEIIMAGGTFKWRKEDLHRSRSCDWTGLQSR
jgi:hypothetical protein